MTEPSPKIVGRYAIYEEIAAGGMATVHFGRLLGPDGFSRTVAIKQLHRHLSKDAEFATMFRDEARLAAKIRHPNVVSILDVITEGDQLCIVMDYVHGESLARIVRRLGQERVPVPVACSIIVGTLHGLHAAHGAKGEHGESLELVHRDVSPHNIMVGVDGVSRVVDFGVAKAVGRSHTTREGTVKGKFGYMAPEQVRSEPLSCRTDVYAASVVLWELLTGKRLFTADAEAGIVGKILAGRIDPPSAIVPDLPEALNAIVLQGLASNAADRFATARDMAREIERQVPIAGTTDVGEWVERSVPEELATRATALEAVEHAGAPSGTMRRAASAEAAQGAGAGEDAGHDRNSGIEGRAAFAPTSSEAPPAFRPKRRIVAGAVGVTLVLAVGVVVGAAVARNAPHPDTTSAGANEPMTAPSVAPAASTPSPAATTEASAALPAKPLASPPAAAQPAAQHVRAPAPPPRHVGQPARPGCSPPYTTDPDGTRRYKLECL